MGLSWSDSGQDFHVFETRDGIIKEEIFSANEFLDRALGYFQIDLRLTNTQRNYSKTYQLGCFSSLHD